MAQAKANIDKEWFAHRMKERGLTQRGIAGPMKLNHSAISRALNGERRMTVQEVRRLAEILESPEGEVLAHLDVSNDPGRGNLMQGPASKMSDQSDDGSSAKAPAGQRHPGFGFMKGLLTIEEGYDLTSPSDEDWENGYLGIEETR